MPQESDVEGVSVRRQGAKPHREREREKKRDVLYIYIKSMVICILRALCQCHLFILSQCMPVNDVTGAVLNMSRICWT